MPNECAGSWESKMIFDKLPEVPIPIGSVIINDHGTEPTINGHLMGVGIPQTLQGGSCIKVPAAGTATHHILKFRVRVSGELFEFRGLIRAGSLEVITGGSFRSLGGGGGTDPGDTGTWEASKGGLVPGTGGEGQQGSAGKKAAQGTASKRR